MSCIRATYTFPYLLLGKFDNYAFTLTSRINYDTLYLMSRKKMRGYVFITFKGDHRPYHVHIYKDRKEIGRWDIENQKTMDGFEINNNLKSALIALKYMLVGEEHGD